MNILKKRLFLIILILGFKVLFCTKIKYGFDVNETNGKNAKLFSLLYGRDKEVFFLEEKLSTTKLSRPIDCKKLKAKIFSECNKVVLNTSDKVEFEAIFFDRGSDKLVVLGQGFPGTKETWWYEIEYIFNDYDVVIFDYRWRNTRQFVKESFSLFRPVRSIIQSLITPEKEEVKSVVEHFKKLKKYDDVIGVGLCFSCFSFIKAQQRSESLEEPLFSKLILEGCWPSFLELAQQVQVDPWLLSDPIKGGTPQFIKSILTFFPIYYPLLAVSSIIYPDISIQRELSQLRCEQILFIHGKNDPLIPFETGFKKVWDQTNVSTKIALVTPYHHCEGMDSSLVYESYVCRHMCREFIKSISAEAFLEKILEQIQ